MGVLTPTEKQLRTFNLIKDFSTKNGYPPTLRELKEKLGYKSISSVQQHIDALVKKGLLKKAKVYKQARVLAPVESIVLRSKQNGITFFDFFDNEKDSQQWESMHPQIKFQKIGEDKTTIE